jgi:hypothetical protein
MSCGPKRYRDWGNTLMKQLLIILALSVSGFAQFQNAEIVAPDGLTNDQFGRSISLSGDVLAVISGTDSNRGGTIYMFQKGAGGWGEAILLATLTAKNGDLFSSVFISGIHLVAGSKTATVNGVHQQGCAYVFVADEGWHDATETAKLTSSDGYRDNWFGGAVAINSSTIIVGASGAGSAHQGEAYEFTAPPSGWVDSTETAKLTASNGENGDEFGAAVDVSGVTAFVGAPSTAKIGAVYVFRETVGGWQNMTETAELTDGKGEIGQRLGSSVADQAYTVVAGAPGTTGKALIYIQPPSGGWVNTDTPTATLSSTETNGKGFGTSVAISATSFVAVGDPNAASGGHGQHNGAAFAFERPASGWTDMTETAKLDSKGGKGVGVSITGAEPARMKILVGAPATKVGKNAKQGAVFVFTVK